MNEYDIFEYLEMPEEYFERQMKRQKNEPLRSKIHIGDCYSDIKAKLPTLDTMKTVCTSYTDYYLSDLRVGKDGTVFAYCLYSRVDCLRGPLPPVAYCRLNFNRNGLLVSIEDS